MLTFNHHGYLIPNTNIRSTLNEFRAHFVDKIASRRRNELYNNYLNYSDQLKTALGGNDLLQWIDGSYVTKKEEPGDIDLITFIDGTVIEQLNHIFDPFKYPRSLQDYGVDAYLVAVYDHKDRKHPLFIGDQMYWMDLFDKTQRSRNGQKHPKGFLEII